MLLLPLRRAGLTLVLVAAVIGAGCGRGRHGVPPPATSGADEVAPVEALPSLPAPPSAQPSDAPFFVADPTQRVVPIRRADAPNFRYGRLDRETCEAELGRRGVPFVRGEPTEGVSAPVRLRGPLHGVSIHTALGVKERERSIYEIFDCRLVLALDDFAEVIAKRGVVEILHLNAYRPKSQYGCTARYWGLQHCAALAIDVRAFKRSDGSVLEVERDFHGRIGLPLCAGGAGPTPPSAAATELWSFVCEGAQRALFNVILTPNYNTEHRNHFHLEITPDAGWMMVK